MKSPTSSWYTNEFPHLTRPVLSDVGIGIMPTNTNRNRTVLLPDGGDRQQD